MDNNLIHFDESIFNYLSSLMGNNIKMLLNKYITSSKELIIQVEKGIKNQDYDIIAHSAHPLKSSSAQIGFMKMSNIAKEIENYACTKKDLNNISTLYQNLKIEFKEVEKTLSTKL